MNTKHGTGVRKAVPARKGRKVRRRSMPATAMGTVSLDFAGLTLGQLCTLIDLARDEAKRRLEVL